MLCDLGRICFFLQLYTHSSVGQNPGVGLDIL